MLPPVVDRLRGSKIAFIGGGNFCLQLITFFQKQDKSPRKPAIIGVADVNQDAVGITHARQTGIWTTADYTQLYQLPDLQLLLEITRDQNLPSTIEKTKPPHIQLIDHYHARYLWDMLMVEDVMIRMLSELPSHKGDIEAITKLFIKSFDCYNAIISRRNERSRQIELELVKNERTQSQIIQGSTIPTFVIDKQHRVTHWNKALEKLTGFTSESLVGTNHQWMPFYDRERPAMVDVILEQLDEEEIQKLYGSWRKSALIEGGYEAEGFFPNIGEGKWLWFTAAPLKEPDGTIVGAIETLWDKTEDRKAEEEREIHSREMEALCSIYTALSAPLQIDARIQSALKEIHSFLAIDDISIFLRNGSFTERYHYPPDGRESSFRSDARHQRLLCESASKGVLKVIDRIDPQALPELTFFSEQGFVSLAMVPVSAREKKSIGVLQLASRSPLHFDPGKRNVLELIGNRIGVAVENAMLQQQYIKSEEKYRSLFNNDPNPIFILDLHSFKILDVNERAKHCYGYSRKEFVNVSFLELGEAEDSEVRPRLTGLPIGQSALFSKKRHFRKNGSGFHVNINVSRARYGESEVLIATTTDISESVEKETQLIQASKMTTLGLMAAGMAHEINQPLNVIQICADLILKLMKKGSPVPQEELCGLANDIIANVDRASGIIRHVRDFARQSEVVKSRLCINAPIQDVFKVMGHQIKAHRIELDLDLAPDIPFILADHNRLEQVFINLVTNAIDAIDEKSEMPEHQNMVKRLRIRTELRQDRVVASVSDNGIGMSAEIKNKMFEPFFTTKKVGKGTGLGVSISYGIVKDYEGTIEIESGPGLGTTFALSFPAAFPADCKQG